MSLFETMLAKASAAQQASAGTDFPLLTDNLDDVNKTDRDIVMNDMQKGDVWLWVLKNNGCGTWMILLDGNVYYDFAKHISEEGSKLFLIDVRGVNKGEIKSVSAEFAVSILDKCLHPQGRVARRETVYDSLTKLLDLETMGIQLSMTRLWSDFTVAKGDLSYIKLSISGGQVTFAIKRPVFTLQRRNIKTSMIFSFTATESLKDLLSDGDKYYQLSVSDNLHGVITEICEKVYIESEIVEMAA